jgi:hypothetical protein
LDTGLIILLNALIIVAGSMTFKSYLSLRFDIRVFLDSVGVFALKPIE